MREKIIIGSRGSALALWQTNWVKTELEKYFPTIKIEVELIKTTGDKILDSPLSKIGDKGLFTKELETALIDNRIDLAVHSLKDVPTKVPDGLSISAITKREDVRDVFVAPAGSKYSSLDSLPIGTSVATGSLRRKCQLLSWRSDLQIIDIRGNLNTRFAKLDESDWSGMILARAGVVRLGWEKRITQILPLEKMLPAVGQGALGIETRTDDASVNEIVLKLNNRDTEISAKGERALLRHLEGGCQIPIGAFGRIESGVFKLDALIGSLDGKRIVRDSIEGKPEDSEILGIDLAERLLKNGGDKILKEIR